MTIWKALTWCSLLILLPACLLSPAEQPSSTRAISAQANKKIQADYGKLPLRFEANRGQMDPRAKFVSQGQGYSVWLTSGGMVLSLDPSAVTDSGTASTSNAAPAKTNAAVTPGAVSQPAKAKSKTILMLNLVGAAANPQVVGEDPLPTKVNYFIGNDPSKWLTNVPTYSRVRYKNIYPGIDLVYYGNNRQVEYDFEAAPGADTSKIQFDVKGADSIQTDAEGNLVLKKGTGTLQFKAPMVYQKSNGKRVPVTGGYAVQDSSHVGFKLAQHDSSKPVVIDPVLVYSGFLGGRSNDAIAALDVDSEGNVYVAGITSSSDFPLAAIGTLTPTQQRTFVGKMDVSGSSLLYADYISGTSGNDYAEDIKVDSTGAAYLSGYAYSSDFPVTQGAYQTTLGGSVDAFITKISPDGSSLVYSTYLGGSNEEYNSFLTIDSAGEVYIAGTTYSEDFPVTSGAYQTTVSESQFNYYGSYGYITKLSADGSSLVFSTYLAGNTVPNYTYCSYQCEPETNISGVVLDGDGNVLVAGNTDTVNFPTTSGAYQTTFNPSTSYGYATTGFISKFSSSGSLSYSTYFSSTSTSSYSYLNVTGLAVDNTGAAYITGETPGDGTLPVTTGTLCDYGTYGSSCGEIFAAKFDPTLATLDYSTYVPPNNTSPQKIAVDANGNAYVLGYAYGASDGTFPMVNTLEPFVSSENVFLAEIDPSASSVLFSTYLGADNSDEGEGLALDSKGAIYVAGQTSSTYFPVTQGAFQNTFGGSNDGFIVKIAPDSAPGVSITPNLLQYAVRTVGTTSSVKTTLLRNMGSAPLTINSRTTTGDFAETDDCGDAVDAGSSCTISVTFTPTAPGARYGSILFGDDAANSPHFINLVGNGSTPLVTLDNTSLTFDSLPVGNTSDAKTITLSNTGNATLNTSSIAATGAFAETNNCPAALAFGDSCQIQVTFTPSAGGVSNGTVVITDDAPDSPQTVTLTGSGYVTTATVSPGSVTFQNQTVATTSDAQTITVSNTGSNAMTVASVVTTGDFAQTNNCTTVATGGSCTVSVTFTPTVSGSRTGTLAINDNAQGNPHTVALSGTGIAGAASISPASLTFSTLNVGTASTAKTLTVTNTGNGSLTLSGIQTTGDFSETNDCGGSVAPSASCSVQVTFTPTASGARTGTISFTDSAGDSPQTVQVSGTGIDFSMSSMQGNANVQAGGTATFQFTVSSAGGDFTSAVDLSCSGVPAFATCTVNPTSVTPGSNSATVTVTINTATTTAVLKSPHSSPRPLFAGWWMASQGLGVFGIMLVGGNRRRMKRSWYVVLGIVLLAAILLAGCGGSSKPTTPTSTTNNTPSGTYTVLVIGKAGSVQHFTSLTLTVQ